MGIDRYEQLKKKADRDELTRDDYLELLRYEKPAYYNNLQDALLNWETMDDDDFERIMDSLEPMDREYVMESIDHAIGYPDD